MVEIIATENIDDKKQYVFIKVSIEKDVEKGFVGGVFEHTTIQPWNRNEPLLAGKELQDWCSARESRYVSEVLKDISNGVVKAHPGKLKVIEDIKSASNIAELKTLLIRIVKHIK